MTTPRMDMKKIVEAVAAMALQKSLSIDFLYDAMERALAEVIEKSLSAHGRIRVCIDRENGVLEFFRTWTISDEDSEETLSLHSAKNLGLDAELGQEIEQALDHQDLSRVAYHQARQVLTRIVREADRNRIAENYRRQIKKILSGKVKKVTREHVLVEIEEGIDGILLRRHMIDRDIFRIGDRIRVLLIDVTTERSTLLKLSRTEPEFLIELFRQEVPECQEGSIQIKAAARDPGSRAKVAVKSNDVRIDPVGACIGFHARRIHPISQELNGERIDVFLWDSDIAQLTINALAPARIESITINESNHSMDIAVPQDQLATAIGKNGQNIRLASQLVGWQLNVMTKEQAETRFKTRSMLLTCLFKEALDVEDEIAAILIREGYGTLEELVGASMYELASIPEFDHEIAQELLTRARQAMIRQAIQGKVYEASDLYELSGMSEELAQQLLAEKIQSKADLADFSVDELMERIPISEEMAGMLILEARKDWFDETKENE